MYTSYIGKKFLQYYNEEYRKKYTAEEFFDIVMFPLFFDNEKYFMRVKNSPFDQLTTTGAKLKLYKNHEERIEANRKLKTKIYAKELAVHTFIGYGEMNTESSTSGQISNIDFNKGVEEFYCSWIGQGLAIKTGKINILFDNKEVLLHIYKGWEHYRDILNNTTELVKNQINTWNSKWLLNNFRKSNLLLFIDGDLETKGPNLLITSTNWVKLIFELSKNFSHDILIINSYEIGDKFNVSLGFLNIYLKDFKELYEIRDEFFLDGKNTILSDKQIEDLIPFYNFSSACQQGTLGLKSVEPRGLRKYLPKSTYKYSQGKEINIETEENYYLYKLWILAMLNKKELLHLSEELADILVKIQEDTDDADRGKTINQKMITDVFDSKSVKSFIDKMTEINKQLPSSSTLLKNVVMNVVDMPRDNFPLFLTLIKFEYYNTINKKGN